MKSNQDNQIAKRLALYGAIASKLELLSNKRLLKLVQSSKSIGTSIGGETSLLKLDDATIFVKKIPLTDLEKQPENIMSTANVFDLPAYFQYGIGSPGFGVWRELAAHTMSTNWVLTGECLSFPLMYHWRLLPKPESKSPSSKELKKLEDNVAYWGGSVEIRNRFEANLSASTDIILFSEYIPENLHQWLQKKNCVR